MKIERPVVFNSCSVQKKTRKSSATYPAVHTCEYNKGVLVGTGISLTKKNIFKYISGHVVQPAGTAHERQENR